MTKSDFLKVRFRSTEVIEMHDHHSVKYISDCGRYAVEVTSKRQKHTWTTPSRTYSLEGRPFRKLKQMLYYIKKQDETQTEFQRLRETGDSAN